MQKATYILLFSIFLWNSVTPKTITCRSTETNESTKPKLPKPALGENSLQTSVFSNPFVEAELAKAAILEKHVKMVYVDFLITTNIIYIFEN